MRQMNFYVLGHFLAKLFSIFLSLRFYVKSSFTSLLLSPLKCFNFTKFSTRHCSKLHQIFGPIKCVNYTKFSTRLCSNLRQNGNLGGSRSKLLLELFRLTDQHTNCFSSLSRSLNHRSIWSCSLYLTRLTIGLPYLTRSLRGMSYLTTVEISGFFCHFDHFSS